MKNISQENGLIIKRQIIAILHVYIWLHIQIVKMLMLFIDIMKLVITNV